MDICEKIAYIKGLAEGLAIDDTTKEGKVLGAIIDLLADITEEICDIEDGCDELMEQIDAVDEDLAALAKLYDDNNFKYPSIIVDTNHSNSGKQYEEQVRIAKEVLHATRHNEKIRKMVKGLMIESYIEDGCQKVNDNVYGKSITDPCLGWEKTEKLILDLAELRKIK